MLQELPNGLKDTAGVSGVRDFRSFHGALSRAPSPLGGSRQPYVLYRVRLVCFRDRELG